jgi:L-iditol 2-dehydrogenase
MSAPMTAPSETLPASMRVSVLSAARQLTVEDRALPVLAANEVLVKVAAVGVCGSDVHYFEHGRIGDYVVESPLVLGHEASGVIVAIGDDVDAARVGRRVSIEPQRPCRTCEQCREGRYNLCARMAFYATPPVDGAFTEYVSIESDFAYDVPDSVSDDAAALVEPLSVGVWACEKAGVRPGDRVLIAGAGPIGLVLAQVARAFGASEVHMTDVSDERLAFAAEHGATHTRHASAPLNDLRVNAFIDASGAATAINAGITAVMPAGRVVLVGMGADTLEIPVSLLQNREIWLTGVFRYANTWPRAIQLLSDGLVDLDCLVTGHFGMSEVEGALTAGRQPGSLKAIVQPWR